MVDAPSTLTPSDLDQLRRSFGGAKFARLAALKRTWDPDNVFHRNHNVAPASDRHSGADPSRS